MGVLVAFLHRYLAPFVAGLCAAAATVVDGVPMTVVLLLAAALFCFVNLPGGVRMIKRLAASKSP